MKTKKVESKRQTETVGSLIVSLREAEGTSREALAKKLKITPAYMGHIERDEPVRISPRIVESLKRFYGRKVDLMANMIEGHNYYVRMWRRLSSRRHAS